jgi:hypothetical protein
MIDFGETPRARRQMSWTDRAESETASASSETAMMDRSVSAAESCGGSGA